MKNNLFVYEGIHTTLYSINECIQVTISNDEAYDAYERLEEDALARLRDADDMSECSTDDGE